MKKSLIKSLMTVGVVGLFGLASVAMAAEVDLYGSIRAGVTSANDGKGDGAKADVGKNTSSRIGIKASSDLGNGQSAGAKVEFSIAEPGENSLNTRRRNVWIQGGWGKLTLGKQGGIYRSAANWDQSSYLGGNVRYGSDVDSAEGITYASNIPGPFKFDFELVGEDGIEQWAATAHYNFGLATINIGHHRNSAYSNVQEHVVTNVSYADTDVNGSSTTDLRGAGRDTAMYSVTTSVTINGVVSEMVSVKTVVVPPSGGIDLDSTTTAETGVTPSYDNTVISVNGSSAGFDWYLAYETSKRNSSKAGDVNLVATERYATIGTFASYAIGESDKIYTEYESGKTKSNTDKKTAFLVGYSHELGEGISFAGEYVAISDREDAKTTKSNTLALVLKYDF